MRPLTMLLSIGKQLTGDNCMVFDRSYRKGTLLWHAHFSWLQATVYGAIIIYPKNGVHYPFKAPHAHIIVLGEYWLKDAIELEKAALAGGGVTFPTDAYTINGHPGPNYNCSANDVYKIEVVAGKTYWLRIINAALNMEHFFTNANHKLTIVEADTEYTKPFSVNWLMSPGQTMNILVKAD
ncbi:hypothetical protein Sjap_005159 [Stephania japonica]|uniref:laccase n=1 Tax=Stephania japonica TaxID=461633 RepID=A0AAP0PLK7_9MAGN